MKRLLLKCKAKLRRYFRNSSDSPQTQPVSKSAIRPFKLDKEPSKLSPGLLEPTSEPSMKSNSTGVACYSRFESLPPEIRRHLLSLLDLPRLKAVVLASPVYHQQYVIDRNYLLAQVLQVTLGSVIVDAYAVHLCRTKAEAARDIPRFIELRSNRFSWTRLPISANLTQNEILALAAFYFQHVQPIIPYFISWLSDGFTKERNPDCSHSIHACITDTEMIRLRRSMYQFQLLCQVTDVTRNDRWNSRESDASSFLQVLEPWQVEELFSFYPFVESVQQTALDTVRQDLHPDHPRFDDQGRPPTPEGAFDFDDEFGARNLREGLTLRGLPFLGTILFHPKDHEQLVSTIQKNMVTSYIPFDIYQGLLGEAEQCMRRDYSPSERDKMQDRKEPLVLGDGGLDYPPLAWSLVWGGTYSNLYGYYIPEEMRRWGYVFWDAKTIEKVGGKEMLARQWEKNYEYPLEDYDPRECP